MPSTMGMLTRSLLTRETLTSVLLGLLPSGRRLFVRATGLITSNLEDRRIANSIIADTLTPTQAPEPSTTPAVVSSNSPVTTSSAAPVSPTSTVKLPVPTPEPITYATPGTYTVPATTVTVSETTTVCGASSTHVVPGTHTVGGVTTVVETATTITCPVATATTNNGVVTSIITSTEYVCPSAGTYTVAPITTTVTEECDIHFPVPTSYAPGTYTIPQQVVTVTETNYVYYCPYTSSGLPTSSVIPVTLSPTKPIEALKPTTASPASQSEAPKSEASKSSDSPKPTSSSTPNTSKPPSGGFDGSFGGKGNHYGITYTPYYGESGDCKDATQVKKDLQEIKNDGFNVIRVYGTDCNALETIGPACEELGIRIILGVFVKGASCSYESKEIKDQVDAIANWKHLGLVDLMVIGNEVLMQGLCQPTDLASLVTTAKSKWSGYSGPFTIAETLNIWERSDVTSALCGVVDYTGANIHPYFNSQVTPATAGEFVSGQLDILDGICSGKKAINLECGWPAEGSCNGSACPGKKEQLTALKSIRESCGDRTVFFSFENDMWKQPGSCGCEQSWGCKEFFKGLL